ncbi:MAG TPA: alpha/beta hydrolase [Nitrososphaerales archaeon]|nr:alpha/beta hydrolase [Nitrososphaerales archaeon]
MIRKSSVRLPSGRIIELSEGGDPNGLPIFTLHGTPDSRLLFPPHVIDAESHGIRLIGYNRPGYGGSTPVPGRRIVDAATDVAAIADNLALDKFAVWGISGGGAPALACAAALPERVVAATSIAGVAPYPTEGLDWLAGMGEFNVEDFNLMLNNQAEWELKSRKDADDLLKATKADLVRLFSTLLSEVDRSVLTGELAESFLASFREAYEVGIRGACDDSLALAMPWGFDPDSIEVPVQIWHGRQDKFVPFAHGEWLATHIPRAEAHLEKDEGHLSLLVRKIPDVHQWLTSKF